MSSRYIILICPCERYRYRINVTVCFFRAKRTNITSYVVQGQLIGIMGKIGSGKTLLLDGILAEIMKTTGVIAVNDDHKGFGYVKQNPWLQRGTIRENILFGKPYDHNKYK